MKVHGSRILLALAVCLLCVQGVQAAIFTEDFESGLGAWYVYAGGATSTEQAHSGEYSFVAGNDNAGARHEFGASISNCKVTAWMYDTSSDLTGDSFVVLNATDRSVALAVETSAVPLNYIWANTESGVIVFHDTGIVRTTGWHKFEFDVTAAGVEMYIDGAPAGTYAGQTELVSITIEDRTADLPHMRTWFDDVTVESITPASPSAWGRVKALFTE